MSTHPNYPNPNAPGNVPVWRCSGSKTCDDRQCPHRGHHVETKWCLIPTSCSQVDERVVCKIVGFRTPARCEDCANYDNEGISETACKLGTICRGMAHYTLRQAGKENL